MSTPGDAARSSFPRAWRPRRGTSPQIASRDVACSHTARRPTTVARSAASSRSRALEVANLRDHRRGDSSSSKSARRLARLPRLRLGLLHLAIDRGEVERGVGRFVGLQSGQVSAMTSGRFSSSLHRAHTARVEQVRADRDRLEVAVASRSPCRARSSGAGPPAGIPPCAEPTCRSTRSGPRARRAGGHASRS